MRVLIFGLLLSFILFPYSCESFTEVFSIAKDSNDNTYLVGNRDANFFIGKKSASCVLQWESTAGSTSSDDDNDVNAEVLYDAIIGQGDVVYAVGSTKGNFSSPLDKVPNLDAAVLVYDPGNGAVVLQKQYDIAADLDNIAQAIAQKPDGNLLIAVHGSVSNIQTSIMYETRLLDIDSQTLDVQRVHEIKVTTTEGLFSLTGGPKLLDFVYEESSNSIISVGHILGRGILWQYDLTTKTTKGQAEWGEVLGNFQISGFTTDGNGAYFVVGSSSERVLGNSDLLSTVNSEFHAYVIRYDNLDSSPSSSTWIRQLAGAGSSQSGRGIAIDPVTGDLVVVGNFDSDFTVTDGQTSETFTVDSIADNGITDVFLWILDAATGNFKGLRSSSVASTESEDRGNTVSVLSTGTIHIGGIMDDGKDAGATVCDMINVPPSPSPSLSSTASITPSRTTSAVPTASQKFLPSSLTTSTASVASSPPIVPSLSEPSIVLWSVPPLSSTPKTSSFQSIVVPTISASATPTRDAMLQSSFEVIAAPSMSLHTNSFSSTFEVSSTPFEMPSDIFEFTASSSPVVTANESPILMDSSLTMETAEVQLLEPSTASNLYFEVSLFPAVTAVGAEESRSREESSPFGGHDVSEFPSPVIFSDGFASHESSTPSFTSGAFPTAFIFSSIPSSSSQNITREGAISPTFSIAPMEGTSTSIPSNSVSFTLVELGTATPSSSTPTLVPSVSVSFALVDLGTATPSPSTPTLVPSVSVSFALVDLGTATPSSSALPMENATTILSTENPSFIPDLPFASFESSLGFAPSPALNAKVNFNSPTPSPAVNSVIPISGTISSDSNDDSSDFSSNIEKNEDMGTAEPEPVDKSHLASARTPRPSDIFDGNISAAPDASSPLSVETPEQTLLAFEAALEPSSVLPGPSFTPKDGTQEPFSTPDLLESSYDGFSESPAAMKSEAPSFGYPSESALVQTPSIFLGTEFGTPIDSPMSIETEAISGPAFGEKITPEEISHESNEIYPYHLIPSADSRTLPTDMLETPEASRGAMQDGITYPMPSVNVQDAVPLTESLEGADPEPSANGLRPSEALFSASDSPIARKKTGTDMELSETPSVSLLQTTSVDTTDPSFSQEESGDGRYFAQPSQQSMLFPNDANKEEDVHENFTTEALMNEEGTLRASPPTLQTLEQNLNEDVPTLRSHEPEGTLPHDREASAVTQAAGFLNDFDGKEGTPQPSLYSNFEQFFDRIQGSTEGLTPDPSAKIFELLPMSSVAMKDEMEEFDNFLTASDETNSNYPAGPSEEEGSPPSSKEDQPQTKEASSSPFQTHTHSSSTGPQPSEKATVMPTTFSMPSLSIELSGPTSGFAELPDGSFAFSPQSHEADLNQVVPTPFEAVSDGLASPSEELFLATPEASFGGMTRQSMEYMLISTAEVLPSPSLNSPDHGFNTVPSTTQPGVDPDDGVETTSESLVVIPSLTASPFVVLGSPIGSLEEIGEQPGFPPSTNHPFLTPVISENSGEDSSGSSGPQLVKPTPSTAASALVSMTVPPTGNPSKAPESALSPTFTPTGIRERPGEPTASSIDIVLASATPSSSPTSSQRIQSATPFTSATILSGIPAVSVLFTSVSPLVSKDSIPASPTMRGVTITPNHSAKSDPSDIVSIVLPSATPSSSSELASNNTPSSTTFDATRSSSPTLPSMSPFSSTPGDTSNEFSPTIAPSASVQMNTPFASPSSVNNEVLASFSFSQTAGSPEAFMSPSPSMSRGVNFSEAVTVSMLPPTSIQISSRPSSARSPAGLPSISPQPSSLATSASVPTITPQAPPIVTSPSFLPSIRPEHSFLETPKFLPSIPAQPSSLEISPSASKITPRPSLLVKQSFSPSVCPGPTSVEPSIFLPSFSSKPPSLGTLTPLPTITPHRSTLVTPSFLPAFCPEPLETPTYLSSTRSASEEGEASASLIITPYSSEDFGPSTSAAFTPASSEDFDPSMTPLIYPSISEDMVASTFPALVPSPSRIELETSEPTSSSTGVASSSPSPSGDASPTGECMGIGTLLTDPGPLKKTRNFQRVNMSIQVAGPSLTDSCQLTATIAERFILLSAINTLSEAEMWHITSVEDGPPVFEEGSSLVIIEQEDNSEIGIARMSPTPSNESSKRIRFAGSAIFNVTAFMDSLSVALASGPYVEYINSQNIVKVMTAEGFDDIKWTGLVDGPVIVDARVVEGGTRTTRGRLSSGEISALAMGALLIVGVAVFVIVEGGISNRRPGPMLPI